MDSRYFANPPASSLAGFPLKRRSAMLCKEYVNRGQFLFTLLDFTEPTMEP